MLHCAFLPANATKRCPRYSLTSLIILTMKYYLIMAAGLLLFPACTGKKGKETAKGDMYSDLVAEHMQGNISSIEETPYQTDSTGKMGDMDSCCIAVFEYDENGNNVKWTSKDSKGTVKEMTVTTRYDNGKWKGQTSSKDGKTVNSFQTTVDEQGKYNGGMEYDSAGNLVHYYTGLSENEQGQVLSWKQWDKDSVYRMEGQATYDKYLQMSATMKDSVGKVKSSSASKFNDKGEQIEMSSTNVTKDSSVTTVTRYTYDSHDASGNWTQRTTWNDKGKATKIIKRTYTYRKEEAGK